MPDYRDVKDLIFKKSKQLLKDINENHVKNLKSTGEKSLFIEEDAQNAKSIPSGSVQLVVTSPPFLNIVQYPKDNWLRSWFNNTEKNPDITMTARLDKWNDIMTNVLKDLHRVLKPGGWVAFEVGEIRKGSIKLDEHILPLGLKIGLKPFGIMINQQKFTKTSTIWGINNNEKGTNTNRIVLFQKP
jgi:hypothetical protein